MSAGEHPRVDFYLLQGNNADIQRFCCRLTDKAWKMGHRITVRVASEHDAHRLDDLMWSYSEQSFLPHARFGNTDTEHSPVIIGLSDEIDSIRDSAGDLLINLASDVPRQCADYARIAEIINEDDTVKKHGRSRYSHYDKNNYPLELHEIKEN